MDEEQQRNELFGDGKARQEAATSQPEEPSSSGYTPEQQRMLQAAKRQNVETTKLAHEALKVVVITCTIYILSPVSRSTQSRWWNRRPTRLRTRLLNCTDKMHSLTKLKRTMTRYAIAIDSNMAIHVCQISNILRCGTVLD